MNKLESTLSDLVAIPSVTGEKEEKEIIDYVENLLNNILLKEENLSGVNVSIEKIEKVENGDYKGGIICNIHTSDGLGNIGLLGHLDVVPAKGNWGKNPFTLTDEGDKYYGRGVADMKSGCSIMIETLRESLKSKPRKNISLIFTSGEEGLLPNGLTKLIESKKLGNIDFIIALEPTSGKINAGIFGYIDGKFHFKGKSCHSSNPSLGENAIHKMGKLLRYLENPDCIQTIDYFNEKLKEAFLATKISGGVAPNVVPDKAELQVNYRYSPLKTGEEAIKIIEELTHTYGADRFELIEHNCASKIIPVEDPNLIDFINKTKVKLLNVVPFWGDISQTSNKGIPSINFGPGSIKQAHVDDEYLEKKSFFDTWNLFKKYLFN